jgi:hypothetical protein
MFDIEFTAAVWYGILISGVAFSGIINFERYQYMHGINIYKVYLCFNCTQVINAEQIENFS